LADYIPMKKEKMEKVVLDKCMPKFKVDKALEKMLE